jgi:hypothetical protein
MARRTLTAQELRLVIERAGDCCEYCRSRADFATQSFAVEHIVPLSRGGTNDSGNLAWSCPGCNGHKYNKVEAPDPIDGVFASLFHPRNQVWAEHFGWNDDFTLVIGLSLTGRATVAALQMNRTGVVNMRRVLFEMGLHPPAN